MSASLSSRGIQLQRLGKLWSWGLRWLKWLRDRFPLTWLGMGLFLLSGGVLYGYGVRQRDWILLVVGLAGIFFVLLSLLLLPLKALVMYSAVRRRNRDRSPELIWTDTSYPLESGFAIPAQRWPFLDFSWSWLHPPAEVSLQRNYRGQRTEEVLFARRGFHQRIRRRFVLRDVFGFCQICWEEEEEADLWVLPRLEEQTSSLFRAWVEGDGMYIPGHPPIGDRVDTRAYLPGDPIRAIHWKLFARTGELTVRVAEPSATLDRQTMAYLITGEEDEFAAELARTVLDSDSLGEQWFFGADGCEGIASERVEAQRLLARSGNHPTGHGEGLQAFLQASRFHKNEHRLILFAPPDVGAWLPVVQEVLLAQGGVTTLVLALVGEEELPSRGQAQRRKARPLWQRLLLAETERPPSTGEESWRALEEVKKKSGLQVEILRR